VWETIILTSSPKDGYLLVHELHELTARGWLPHERSDPLHAALDTPCLSFAQVCACSIDGHEKIQ